MEHEILDDTCRQLEAVSYGGKFSVEGIVSRWMHRLSEELLY